MGDPYGRDRAVRWTTYYSPSPVRVRQIKDQIRKQERRDALDRMIPVRCREAHNEFDVAGTVCEVVTSFWRGDHELKQQHEHSSRVAVSGSKVRAVKSMVRRS